MSNGRFYTSLGRILMFAIAVGGTDLVVAAPVNHGDFFGSSVQFLQVTETVNAGGQTAPIFGPPQIIGDQLDFDPKGFATVATNGNASITDGQLDFTLMSVVGYAIESLSIDEGGDFTLVGNGTAATNVSFSLSLATLKVLEVDGISLFAPITLDPVAVSGNKNLASDPGIGQFWALSSVYDVNAALIAEGVSFNFGATKIEITLDDTLTAISELGTIAAIAKKDFVVIGVSTVVGSAIPEPSTAGMLCVLGLAIARRRRRYSAVR